MAQSKRWCFTINNYTEEEVGSLHLWGAKYIIAGREKAPDTGTPHLQGYVIWHTNRRLSACKSVHSTAHWEVAKGTTEQNVAYCSKEDDYVEYGEKPDFRNGGEAEKLRWKQARELAVIGNLEDVPDDIYIRYYRTLKEIAKDNMSKPSDADDVTGVWLYGPPGTGKSRKARDDYPGAYLKMQNKWWDGYQGEEFVIIDDLDSKELGHLIKIWADRYSFLAETKGGAVHIRPKKIVITSNYSIEELWVDEVMAAAIKRRMHVVHMHGDIGQALQFAL